MVYKFLIKRLLVEQINRCKIKNLQMKFINQLLENFKKRRVHPSFKDNIWGTNLADMQLTSKFNKRIRFLLCVLLTFIANMHGLFL